VQYKLCAWLAVFACLASIANLRRKEFDFRQVLSSVMSDNYNREQQEEEKSWGEAVLIRLSAFCDRSRLLSCC
jgi:hypothetical protein